MRWFHVTKKQSPSGTDATIKDTPSKRLPAEVYFPMKLNVVHRKMRQYQTGKNKKVILLALIFQFCFWRT